MGDMRQNDKTIIICLYLQSTYPYFFQIKKHKYFFGHFIFKVLETVNLVRTESVTVQSPKYDKVKCDKSPKYDNFGRRGIVSPTFNENHFGEDFLFDQKYIEITSKSKMSDAKRKSRKSISNAIKLASVDDLARYQPMDAGIISTLKCHYKMGLVAAIDKVVENRESLRQAAENN